MPTGPGVPEDPSELVVATAGEVAEVSFIVRMLRYSAGSFAPTVYGRLALVPSFVPALAIGLGRR